MNHAAAFLLVLLGLALLGAGTAHATQQGLVVEQKWKSMDKCTKLAQTAFPDFTPEANAKRDAKLKECLAVQSLPPRELPAPAH